MKPVRRISSNAYATIEISNETSLNDSYQTQCYKPFTAIKIPPDFQRQNEITPEMEHPPQQLDCLIVDGFFFLNTFKQMPRSFEDLSKKILKSLVNTLTDSMCTRCILSLLHNVNNRL